MVGQKVGHQPSATSKSEPQHTSLSKGGRGDQDRQTVVSFKVSHILIVIFFSWLTILHIIGAAFFAKGFLLTRLVLSDKSECTILPDGQRAEKTSGCWHPKTFDRAVILIIDALRYDFTVPAHRSLTEPQQKYYLDNLPILHETAVKSPANAFLLPFIADPPTTTLQRLKGLTTGTLPTFIDIGSNFAGTAIEEDNIVAHLKDAGKTIVQLGDDTWQALFPGYFDPNMTRAYDSFNVWDLHTVDNGVIEHIMPLLAQKDAKWDVIFGHFLGVDHAGHRYGPDHPAMAEKLSQMDRVLRSIITQIDDDTLLVVMGDHGMDTKGDHGGESDEEIEAALWMYSKKPRFGRLDDTALLPPATAKERPVGQIDLVSTLSLLLGLPIPFNNLGTPIAEAFAGPGKPDWQNLARVRELSQAQISRYQAHYSQSRDLGTHQNLSSQQSYTLDYAIGAKEKSQHEVAYFAITEWQRQAVATYRKLWANFDIPDMLNGVAISIVALLFLFLFSRFSRGDKTALTIGLLRVSVIGSITGGICGLLLSQYLSSYFTILTGITFGASVSGVIAALFWGAFNHLLSGNTIPSFWGGLSAFFVLSQSAGFASNSYTIHEDSILLFFLTSFGLLSLMSSLRQVSKVDRVLGTYQSVLFILLTRAASYSKLCREEQMPGCRSTFYPTQTSSTSTPWQLVIPYAISFLLPQIIKGFYKGTASYHASAVLSIGLAFRIGLILVAAFWSVEAAENSGVFGDTFTPSSLKTVGVWIARFVFLMAFGVGIGISVAAEPCISVDITTGPSNFSQNDTRSAALLGAEVPGKPQVRVYGYANTFGTHYFLFLPILVLSTIVLLPPMGQYSLAILTWQILCLLEILDTNNLIISPRFKSAIGPTVLALLGSFHFFKTGHQASLASIQWNSAFVPLSTIKYPWSPLLVILNTFGPQIICAAAVPLTVLWKRPTSRSATHGLWNDILNASLTHILYYATVQLATTMWAGHLRRHLMLYRVFMPRYLMATVILIIVDLILIVVGLTGVRLTGLSVGKVFGY